MLHVVDPVVNVSDKYYSEVLLKRSASRHQRIIRFFHIWSLTYKCEMKLCFWLKTVNFKCLQISCHNYVISHNDHLIFTLSDSAILLVHVQQFLLKSMHTSSRCRRKCVLFLNSMCFLYMIFWKLLAG